MRPSPETLLRAVAVYVVALHLPHVISGDGEISRREFHEAMPKLGLEVSKKAIDELFDQWDSDGGGSLEFKELQRILRSVPSPPKGGPKPKPPPKK